MACKYLGGFRARLDAPAAGVTARLAALEGAAAAGRKGSSIGGAGGEVEAAAPAAAGLFPFILRLSAGKV